MVDKCELVVQKVGKLEFESIDNYIEILQEANSKAIPQVFIDGDNQNWIPPHQVCDVRKTAETTENKATNFFTSFFAKADQFYSLLGIADFGEKENNNAILLGMKYVVLLNMDKVAKAPEPETLCYSCYFVEIARIYAMEHGIDMTQKELIFWAIVYANKHVNADRTIKDSIISLLKENARE